MGKRNVKSISVSGAAYERMRAWADHYGISVRELVRLATQHIGTTEPCLMIAE